MNQPLNDPAEFKRRLEQMPEGQRHQMLTLLQAISKPPESLVQTFERIGLRWERRYLDSEVYPEGAVVIDWKQFMAAEVEIQRQGPLLKQLMTAEFGQQVTDKVQVNENGAVQTPAPPTEFKLLDENGNGNV